MSKIYSWTIDRHHYRTGAYMYTSRGVVFANSEEEAKNKVWETMGNDNSCCLEVNLIDPDDGVIEIGA